LRVNLADLRDRAVIDMRDESRDRVKYLIIVVIDAPEKIWRKLFRHREILFWRPADRLLLSLNISYLGRFFPEITEPR
jgi:predicted nuclease with RNAse H fold